MARGRNTGTWYKGILSQPLVVEERWKSSLHPLHIKLGIIKQFVKTLNKDSKCFKQGCHRFQLKNKHD